MAARRGAARDPGADAGDDLVLDGAGPGGPLGDGRLAVRRRGRRPSRSRPRSTPRSPRSTTSWSIEIRPTTGRRTPRTSTSARPEASARQAVGVPERHQREVGRARSCGGRGRSRPACPRGPAGPDTTGAVSVIAGAARVVRDGSMPTSPAPTRLIVWWLRGSVSVAAVAARCRSRGRRPTARAVSSAQAKRVRPSALHSSPGRRRSRGGPSRRRPRPRRAARPAGRRGTARAQLAGSAPSRAIPASRCRCTRPRPGAAATRGAGAARLGTATSTSARRRRWRSRRRPG